MAIEDIKILLGKSLDDSSLDETIEVIESGVTSRLKNIIGMDSVPDELGYIVTEVSIARFNRIGSEGLTSHSVDGETMNFSDNDFAPYMEEIDKYLERQKNVSTGKVRFI